MDLFEYVVKYWYNKVIENVKIFEEKGLETAMTSHLIGTLKDVFNSTDWEHDRKLRIKKLLEELDFNIVEMIAVNQGIISPTDSFNNDDLMDQVVNSFYEKIFNIKESYE